jgi:hypothetical protein
MKQRILMLVLMAVALLTATSTGHDQVAKATIPWCPPLCGN